MLHQFCQVGSTLLRGFVLPVVAQHVDTHHRVADLGHFTGHVTVQVTPAAITRQKQRNGIVLLTGRDFDHRHAQSTVFIAHQDFAQFIAQHLRQMDVVVADAGLCIALIAYERSAWIVRVVVPGHQPVAVGSCLWHGQGASRLFELEAH